MRALCLAAAAISLACRQPKVPEAPLTILLPGQVLSLDPNREMDMITDSVLFNVFEPLVGIDDKLRIRTMLAESWENPRPEQWRFHLRRNVRFHDGTPLTASLVRDVFLEVRRSPEFEASNFLTPVEDIVVIDEHTLDFITHRPRLLLTNLTTVYVTKRSAGEGFPPLVGTGPYQIREWSPSTRVELARYAGYWGAPPEFGEVAFESVPDAGQREARLVAGKADIIFRAPHTLAARVAPGVRFVHRKGVTVFYLGVNLRQRQGPPLDDLRVRRALHLGLDREALVRQFLHGLGSVATQPIPPDVFGYNPELPEPRRDLVQARRLLEEAGQTRGFKVRLDLDPPQLEAGRIIERSLAEIGVRVELNVVTHEEVYSLAQAGKSDLSLMGWVFSSGEAGEFYEFCLHTPGTGYGFNNYGGYSSPPLDAIAESNGLILQPRGRRDGLWKAAALAMEELPVIPLYVPDDTWGVSDRIRFTPRADNELWLPDVLRNEH